jgi:nicotinamidase-related amidase
MGKKVVLLTIDGQFDFCDPSGALYVSGADKDMSRLAKMIHRIRGDLNDIIATMDSHRTLHIAHPIWWEDAQGNHPEPLKTLITEADVTGPNPKWRAKNPAYRQRSIEYVKTLSANGRYVLCIWPPHCLIGSRGYTIYPELFDAFCEWENQFAAINYVTKGSNIFTEHYSALLADVFDPEDPSTGLNTNLLELCQDPNVALIAISGEASSHCVRHTITDIANNFGEENIKKFVYLEDTCSPVPGFENNTNDFINEMTNRGMKISTSTEFLK